MTPTRVHSPDTDHTTVGATAFYVLTHPWDVFIADWNWKTALFSAIFRLAVWPASKAAGLRLIAPGALRGLLIEFGFRLAIGGFWGSLLQVFAFARPAWAAGLCMIILLPGCAHGLEYVVLSIGGAAHAGTLTIISVLLSASSILVNWGLMRRGILLTGHGAPPLTTDLRKIFGGMIRRRLCQGKPMGNV